MYTITANDLKTKGVSIVEKSLKDHDEATISVRGKERYVIMPIEAYQQLREMELIAAVEQAKQDIANGDYVIESVEKHMKRISK